MSREPAVRGPATVAELQELHGLLVRRLIDGLKADEPPAELLDIARALLKNESAVPAPSEADRKKLRKLYGRLVDGLLAATSTGTPSAAVFAVVRHFLRDQGIVKDVQGALTQAQALAVLTSADLPFNNPH